MSTVNFYGTAIYLILVSVFLLDTIADLLNLGQLKPKLPKEFQDIYDQKKYSESIQYQKEGVHFELIRRSYSLILTIGFIALGGFQWVDSLARNATSNTLWAGLIFVGILSVLRFFVQLPFSIYDTFVIEEKYGFNRTTPKTFCLDILKGGLIGALIGSPIFLGIVYFFETMGAHAWLYSWIAFTLFQIVLTYLAPAIIMPLFNKFTPLQDSPLRKAIENYAKSRNFKLSGIFKMDNSKRSSKSNAFFTGFGKYRRLVLFDTLITNHSTEELVAILAHEIGHFEKKHIVKSMILSILSSGLIFYSFKLFLGNQDIFEFFKMEIISVYAGIVFVGFLISPALRILSLVTQKISRFHEFEADAFAVSTFGKPEVLISALKKLSMDHLSHLTPHPLKVALDYSHPPILMRIKALRAAKR